MESFITTAALAVIVVLGALFLISIGWLLTGKSTIQAGACGRSPVRCDKRASCQLCDEKMDNKDTDATL